MADRGPGLVPGEESRIFEKFYRTQKGKGGVGLGLTICRGIVAAHGGRIWAEPSARGAHFVVALPVEPPAELQGPDVPEARTPERRGTLLLVEETPELGLALKAVLLGRGWTVARAHGAEEGIQLARRLQPAAALLDESPAVRRAALAALATHAGPGSDLEDRRIDPEIVDHLAKRRRRDQPI